MVCITQATALTSLSASTITENLVTFVPNFKNCLRIGIEVSFWFFPLANLTSSTISKPSPSILKWAVQEWKIISAKTYFSLQMKQNPFNSPLDKSLSSKLPTPICYTTYLSNSSFLYLSQAQLSSWSKKRFIPVPSLR